MIGLQSGIRSGRQVFERHAFDPLIVRNTFMLRMSMKTNCGYFQYSDCGLNLLRNAAEKDLY